MLEPPDIAEEDIMETLHASYGLAVATITFLPIGLDPAAGAYRVELADGAARFLKVRKGEPSESGLIVPHYLRERGVSQVVAPAPTDSGALSASTGEFTLILYPFIDGTTGTEHGMDERLWIEYGAVLRQIHDTAVTLDLAQRIGLETSVPAGSAEMRWVDRELDERVPADVIEGELMSFWRARRSEMRKLVDGAEALGQRLRESDPPLVLCHTDIHTWNLLIDPSDKLWVVDWDDTKLAPRECDLMYGIGGIGGYPVRPEREEAWFRAGYGDVEIDPLALAYYRYAHVVADTGAFAESVFQTDVGKATKREAVMLLMRQFERGGMVDLVYEAGAAVGLES